jgi:hypothetical protein
MSEPHSAFGPDLDDEMLARQVELGQAARVHERLMIAETSSDIAELGRTYQRVARSLRQTLALKAKLKRDREAGVKPVAPGGLAVARRVRQVRHAVGRLIWTEAESPDTATEFEEALDDLIEVEMLGDRFCAEDLDDQVAPAFGVFGGEADGQRDARDLPDPPGSDEAPEPRDSG